MKTLFLLLCLAVPAIAQCDLTLAELPSIRGIKLGMEETTFKRLFRRDLKTLTKTELRSVFLSNEIDSIYTDFITNEGKLAYFRLDYDDSLKWNGAYEMAEKVSETLSLPIDDWQKTDRDLYQLTCKDFQITANTILNSVSFTDTRAILPDKINHQRKAAFHL